MLNRILADSMIGKAFGTTQNAAGEIGGPFELEAGASKRRSERGRSEREQFMPLTEEQREQLSNIMEQYEGIAYDEPTIHYGFYGEN